MDSPIDLQRFIVTIVVVGITLIMGLFITSEIGDNTTIMVTTTSSGLDEDVSFTGEITAGIITSQSGATCSSFNVTNSTGDEEEVLAEGNYTVDNCIITVDAESPYDSETVNIAYSYSYVTETNTAATNASEDLVTSLSNGTGWIAILIVVGFATIILALLSSGLGQAASGRRQEQPIY